MPTRRELLKAVAASAVSIKAGSELAVGRQDGALRLPREVRVAIAGLDGHYSEILDVAKIAPAVRVTAVAEPSEAQRRRAAADPQLKGAKFYPEYRVMLDREALDVVAVCGDNASRAEVVCECARRNIAIVAEKPLAITTEELQKVRQALEASRSRMTMLLAMRFTPSYEKMRSIVQAGEIGEVVTVAAQKSYKLGERPAWMQSRTTFGGIIPYIGIHMIDLMRWTSGREFVEVAAFQSNVGAPQVREMENNAALVFRLDNNGTGSLRMDYLRPETAPTHGDDRLRIAGTRGVVEFQELRGVSLITSGRKPEQVTDLPPARYLFADFLDSMYNGRPHVITAAEVFRVSDIVLKAREAAEKGMIVRL